MNENQKTLEKMSYRPASRAIKPGVLRDGQSELDRKAIKWSRRKGQLFLAVWMDSYTDFTSSSSSAHGQMFKMHSSTLTILLCSNRAVSMSLAATGDGWSRQGARQTARLWEFILFTIDLLVMRFKWSNK